MEVFDNRKSYNKTLDSEIIYTGESNGTFVSGESLSAILKKTAKLVETVTALQARVVELENKLNESDSANIAANSELFDLVDETNAISSSLDGKQVRLNIQKSETSNHLDFQFDMRQALTSLDQKYVPIGMETSIRSYGKNQLLGSSSSNNGALTIASNSGPVVVTNRINLRSKDGDIILSKHFYIPTIEEQTLTGTFSVSGVPSSDRNKVSQKDYNEIVASNISRLRKDLDIVKASLNPEG